MSLVNDSGKHLNWLITIILLGGILLFYFFDPDRITIFPRCPFFVITGHYCPGCGSQRALHSILHLELSDAFSYNALMFPASALILYHYLYGYINKIFRCNLPNILYHKKAPLIILIIVLIFWIFRNFPSEPFNYLSPE